MPWVPWLLQVVVWACWGQEQMVQVGHLPMVTMGREGRAAATAQPAAMALVRQVPAGAAMAVAQGVRCSLKLGRCLVGEGPAA
jgi:hypothetical protein